jgi:hypothetical protein
MQIRAYNQRVTAWDNHQTLMTVLNLDYPLRFVNMYIQRYNNFQLKNIKYKSIGIKVLQT